MSFWDANYNITKLSKDGEGNIIELELNGKAVEIGSATLDNNKAATIDVSTYTEPVVITPTSGKDGMKKATVTLSNIPETSALYAWKSEEDYIIYTSSATPSVDDMVIICNNETGLPAAPLTNYKVVTYADNAITIDDTAYDDLTFTRYADGDITL